MRGKDRYGKKCGRIYESIRSEAMSKRREKIKGKPRPREHMEAMWEYNRTVPKTAEHKKKLSDANKGKRITAESARKISEANRGKKRTEEQIIRAAKAQSSISDEHIRAMRQEYDAGKPANYVSRKYNVSLSLGLRIMKRESYKWVSEGVRY